MNSQQSMEERLWDYIDGTMPVSEKSVIEKLLQSDAAWRSKYNDLLELHQMVNSTGLDSPSMRFTRNVMEEITRLHIAPATKTYINKKIVWGIGFFFLTLLIGFLVYGFGQMDWSSSESSTISENLNKVDLSKFFKNTWVNVFMMINVVLGLVLLDNYLSNKRKHFQKA
jgi:hypothetical protein